MGNVGTQGTPEYVQNASMAYMFQCVFLSIKIQVSGGSEVNRQFEIYLMKIFTEMNQSPTQVGH